MITLYKVGISQTRKINNFKRIRAALLFIYGFFEYFEVDFSLMKVFMPGFFHNSVKLKYLGSSERLRLKLL